MLELGRTLSTDTGTQLLFVLELKTYQNGMKNLDNNSFQMGRDAVVNFYENSASGIVKYQSCPLGKNEEGH